MFDIVNRISNYSPVHEILIAGESPDKFSASNLGMIKDALTDPDTYIRRGLNAATGGIGGKLYGLVREDMENVEAHGRGIVSASNAGVPGFEVTPMQLPDGRGRYILTDASDPNNVKTYIAAESKNGHLNPNSIQKFNPDNPAHMSTYGETINSSVSKAVAERESVSDAQFGSAFKDFVEDHYGYSLSSVENDVEQSQNEPGVQTASLNTTSTAGYESVADQLFANQLPDQGDGTRIEIDTNSPLASSVASFSGAVQQLPNSLDETYTVAQASTELSGADGASFMTTMKV